MNWGAFAGAFGQSALSTYERLGEEEMREMQRKKFKQEQADEDAFRAAMRDAPVNKGTGGIDIGDAVSQGLQGFTPEQTQYLQAELSKMPPEQAQAALRAYGASEYGSGALPLKDMGVYRTQDGKMQVTSDFKPMGQSERMGAVLQRMQDSGNISGAQRALQFKSLFRDSEQQDQFDKFTDNLRDVQTFVAKGDAEGFVERLKKDGMDVRLQKGKDGAVALQYFEKGKLVQSFNSLAEAGGALSEQLTTQMVMQNPSLFKDIGGLTAYQAQRYKLKQGDRELGIKEQELASSNSYRQGALQNSRDNLSLQRERFEADEKWRGKNFDRQVASDDRANTRLDLEANSPLRVDVKNTTVKVSEDGIMKTVPVNVVTTVDRAGNVSTRATTLDGKPITDNSVLSQLAAGENPQDAAYSRMMEGLYARFQKGELDSKMFAEEKAKIERMFGKDPVTQAVRSSADAAFGKSSPVTKPATAIPTKVSAPKYTPPADSPAGRSQRIQQEAKDRAAQEKVDRAEASKRADAEVAKALPSMSMEEAAALQDSPTFSLLSPGMKAAVQRKVLGR